MVAANATNRVSLFLGSVLMEFIAFRVAGIIASSWGGTQSFGLKQDVAIFSFPRCWVGLLGR